MEFRKEMNGVALAMLAGIWASVSVGQEQGPRIEDLLLPDTNPAPAAAQAAEPEAAKPATGKYKIVREEKPAPAEQKAEKAAVKPDAEADAGTKPVETAPVAAQPAPKSKKNSARKA